MSITPSVALSVGLPVASRVAASGGIPANALTLQSQPLTLAGVILTLG